MRYQFLLLRLYTQCPMDVPPGMETRLPCHHSSHSAFTIQLHAAFFGLPSLPRQRKYLRTAVILQVSEVSSFCRFPPNPSFFPATSFPVFCPLGTRLWHQWLSWHRGPGQKRSHMPLNPSPKGAQQISLVGVYEPPCPMLLFTMISAFISRQTSACPLLAYNTKLKSLDEE